MVAWALAVTACNVDEETSAPGDVSETEVEENDVAGSALSEIAGYDLTDTPATVDHGTAVTVEMLAPADHSATDWIGLAPIGAPPYIYVDWVYVGSAQSGPFTYTLPHFAAPGDTYELRYFLDNGYTLAATSDSFLVIDVASPHTVAASPALPSPDGDFSVHWTGPANHATTDWIGLYRGHTSNNEIVDYAYVGSAGATSGEVTLSMPPSANPGDLFEIRYFTNNTYTLSIGAAFAVGNFVGAPVDPVTTSSFHVPWRALAEHSIDDWIGLFTVDADDVSALAFTYVDAPGATMGDVVLDMPASAAAGDVFELRYFAAGTYLRVGTSAPFTRGVGLGVPGGTVAPGSIVPVTWSSTAAHATTDWIGLFQVGAANNQILTYVYVGAAGQASGTVNLVLPPGAVGTLEARYFVNNTYELTGRSAPFLVQ